MKSIFLVICCAIIFCNAAIEQSSEEDASDDLQAEIFKAIDHGNVSEVQSLIDRIIQVNQGNSKKIGEQLSIPMDYMISHYHGGFNEEIFKLFIKRGADLEAVDKIFGTTALFHAVSHGNLKAAKILLENGANPNTSYETTDIMERRDYMSVLMRAFLAGDSTEEMVNLLIDHGADINQPDSHGRTPLHFAINFGYKKIIEKLIEKGANVNAVENTWKLTSLHYIAVYDSSSVYHENWTDDDSLKFAELLIDHGADLYAQDRENETPLEAARSEKLRDFLGSKMNLRTKLRSLLG